MWAIEKTQTLFILLALNMLVLLPRGPSHSGERPSVPCTIFNQSRHPQCYYFRAASNEPQEKQNIQSARRRMAITKENNNTHESYQREREREVRKQNIEELSEKGRNSWTEKENKTPNVQFQIIEKTTTNRPTTITNHSDSIITWFLLLANNCCTYIHG